MPFAIVERILVIEESTLKMGETLEGTEVRSVVDCHFGYRLFCLNLFEQKENRQPPIWPRLKCYLICLYFKDQIVLFLTQNI